MTAIPALYFSSFMISQPEIQTKSRRKKLAKTWSSKEWKDRKAEFIKGKVCSWCGATEKLLPHHPYINSMKDGTYLDFYLSGCIVLCTRCHFALHKGKKLCPKCKEHYCNHDTEMCYGCFLEQNPGIKEKIELKKVLIRKKQKELRAASKERTKKYNTKSKENKK